MGPQNARRFLPLIGSLAFFIFFSNLLALIPGFMPPTSMTQDERRAGRVRVHHERTSTGQGARLKYFKPLRWSAHPAPGTAKPVTWLLATLMVVIEMISHFARPVSLSLRLMGNMAADHKVVFAFFVLVRIVVPCPSWCSGASSSSSDARVQPPLHAVYISMAVAHEEH